jgi:hypothetical protein
MAYQPVESSVDQPASSLTSPQSSTSARFTPDSDSEDENEGQGLRDLEDEEGFELREIKPSRREEEEQVIGGAEEDEEDGSEDGADMPLAGQRRRRRRESVQSFELYTPDEEKRVKRKLDIKLVLFVAMLYLISFLDRTNIGM